MLSLLLEQLILEFSLFLSLFLVFSLQLSKVLLFDVFCILLILGFLLGHFSFEILNLLSQILNVLVIPIMLGIMILCVLL